MRPSTGSLARKALKNEIRSLLQTLSKPYPSFIIHQGVLYDIPQTDDLREISRSILGQIHTGGETHERARKSGRRARG